MSKVIPISKAFEDLHKEWDGVESQAPKYHCNTCEDTGWEIALNANGQPIKALGRCLCRKMFSEEGRQEYFQNVYGPHGDHRFWPSQAEAHREFQNSTKTSLWISGETNAGKSFYALNIVSGYAGKVYAIKGKNVQKMFRRQAEDGQWINREFHVKHYDLIAIEDVNMFHMQSDAMKRDLYGLIEDIYEKKRQLVVTSNMTIGRFCGLWPEDVIQPFKRRLMELCMAVQLVGPKL